MRHLRQNFFQKTTVLVFLFFSISIIFFVSGDLVIAQGADVGLEAVSDVSLASTDPRLIAMRVIRVLLGLIGIIALSITVYAGYLWMTSAGNEEQVARAKNMLKQGVIGLLIILSALGIVTFIMSLLLQAVGGISETGRPVGFAGRGALGAGVLKSHYPPRDAVEIPRNINIILTFKVAMDIDTLAIWNDDDADGVREAEDRWELDTTSVRVIRNSDDPQALLTARVYFVPSEFADNENVKTLVIKPDDYLGSPDNDELHTVTLTNTIKTKTNQTAFFINYIWQFTTNTELDFTPPYIIGMELAPEYTADIPTIPVDQQYIDEYDSKRAHANIIPMPYATQTLANTPEPCNNPQHALGACHPWPRNLLVQINFNEAVNPITAAGRPNETLADSAYVGIFQYIGDGVRDMFDVTAPATDDWKVLNGEWRMSTDYRTIEFWADIDPSNVVRNSCGEEVALLPENSHLRVYIKAASPEINDPTDNNYTPQITPGAWDGVVDVADNALDGNGDRYATASDNPFPGTSQTFPPSDLDDFIFLFDTSDEIDLEAPIVQELLPADKGEDVGARDTYDTDPYFVRMGKFISATALVPNVSVFQHARQQPDITWYSCLPNNCPIQGLLVSYFHTKMEDADGVFDHHSMEVFHERLQKDPPVDYAPALSRQVKDLYQNCYSGGCCSQASCGVKIDDHDPAVYATPDPYDPNTPAQQPDNVGCVEYLPSQLP